MNFYGFDWQNTPQYSRLFSPQTVNAGRQAYGQGMSQFTPYDPQQLEKLKAAQAARLQAQAPKNTGIGGKFVVGQDGRVFDISNQQDFLRNYAKYAPTDGAMTYNQVRYALNKGNDLKNIGFKPLGQ